MRRLAALAVYAVALSSRLARAGGPHLDVADLPPLPPAAEPASSAATVLAATNAETDVVVAAAKREQSLGNVASAVTVVTGDQLRRFGYRTVGEALAAVAGVYLVDNRLSYSIGIRGLQIPGDFNTRLLVLVDGATVNEAWGAFAGVGYDAVVAVDDIARIEVIRGPVSSLYGTNAFFGIINIVTRGAAESPRAWVRSAINSVNGVTTNAGLAAGSVQRQVRVSVHFMDRFGDTTQLAELPGSALTGDGSSTIAASVVSAYDGSFAQVRAYRYARQSPFAPYDVNPDGRPYEQHDTQLLVEGGHTRELSSRATLAARIYGNFYRFDDSAPPYAPARASPLDTAGTAQVVGAELRGRYEVIAPGRLGITAGVEASHDRTRSTARLEDEQHDLADDPLVYDVLGAYAELDAQPTPWLGLTAGARYDRYSDPEVDHHQLSPRVALFLASPERYGVKLLYATGFRNPSAFEGHFQDGTDFSSNPHIQPETITSFEVAAWARPIAGLAVRLSGFHWDARDVIEQRQDPADASKLQFQNAAAYRSQGIEAEVSYRDRRGWYAFGGLAVTHVGASREPAPGNYTDVPNSPVVTASTGISTPRLLGSFHLSSELIALGERLTRATATGPSPASPSWLGWNAALYAPDLDGFDLTVGVRNLLGKRDLVPAPGDYDRSMPSAILVPRVPGEGREVYVKLGYAY